MSIDTMTEDNLSESASTNGGALATPDEIKSEIIAVLKTVYDPEIPVDIYEMGLIYDVDVAEGGKTRVVMTLTTPMCPVAETLPPEVEVKVRDVPGVTDVQLELVWEPPWSMDMMSEAARLELNL
jgi:FeS assembly SUF system protein